MGETLAHYANEIWSFIAGVVTGASGCLLSIHYKRKMKVSGNATVTDQSRARAGGDIVGGDKVSRTTLPR